MRNNRPYRRLLDADSDPLEGMANLFDLAMIFAVALMVAMVTFFKVPELLRQEEFTMIKNAGKENMEIIVKKGKQITSYKGSQESGEGKGRKIGIAYELEDGQIIYVPE
ncbi:DUF2149 domain-containing protein [bacterium]|nr:DUF2149 domain-containing protein [bacterium]